MDATRGTYTQRSRYLKRIRDKYKALSPEEQENSKDAKELYQEILDLDRELKSIDQQAGATYRGNYSKIIT